MMMVKSDKKFGLGLRSINLLSFLLDIYNSKTFFLTL